MTAGLISRTAACSIITAIVLAVVISCTPVLPDLRPPVEVNTVVPQSDISPDSDKILDTHNRVRQQLGIPPLAWSNQMEVYSTEWALFLAKEVGCSLKYRGSVGLPLHKNGLGENLYKHDPVIWTDGRREVAQVDPQSVVVEWARQSTDYDYVSNTCGLNAECSEYTQVVWRDSRVVGCGAASCPDKSQIWVCNYDPPGNFLNQRPY